MALNSVCWHLCISKYFKDWNSDEWTTKRTSKDRGQKRTNTGAPFWAYGSDDFLRSVQMVPRPEMTTWSLKDAGASWSGDWLCSWWACALLYQTETQTDNMQRLWLLVRGWSFLLDVCSPAEGCLVLRGERGCLWWGSVEPYSSAVLTFRSRVFWR